MSFHAQPQHPAKGPSGTAVLELERPPQRASYPYPAPQGAPQRAPQAQPAPPAQSWTAGAQQVTLRPRAPRSVPLRTTVGVAVAAIVLGLAAGVVWNLTATGSATPSPAAVSTPLSADAGSSTSTDGLAGAQTGRLPDDVPYGNGTSGTSGTGAGSSTVDIAPGSTGNGPAGGGFGEGFPPEGYGPDGPGPDGPGAGPGQGPYGDPHGSGPYEGGPPGGGPGPYDGPGPNGGPGPYQGGR